MRATIFVFIALLGFAGKFVYAQQCPVDNYPIGGQCFPRTGSCSNLPGKVVVSSTTDNCRCYDVGYNPLAGQQVCPGGVEPLAGNPKGEAYCYTSGNAPNYSSTCIIQCPTGYVATSARRCVKAEIGPSDCGPDESVGFNSDVGCKCVPKVSDGKNQPCVILSRAGGGPNGQAMCKFPPNAPANTDPCTVQCNAGFIPSFRLCVPT